MRGERLPAREKPRKSKVCKFALRRKIGSVYRPALNAIANLLDTAADEISELRQHVNIGKRQIEPSELRDAAKELRARPEVLQQMVTTLESELHLVRLERDRLRNTIA